MEDLQKQETNLSPPSGSGRLGMIESFSLCWLKCKTDPQDSSLVDVLLCSVCQKYDSSIKGTRNFSSTWIEGSMNHRTSSLNDHAKSDQHMTAMMKLRTEQAKTRNKSLTSYSSIARSLLVMDEAVKDRLRKKFEICYVMAKEKIAFRKYPALHALEARHGVDLGEVYKTEDSAKNFTHFIAKSQRQNFVRSLSNVNFYSFIMDGSTDAGKIEDELIIILYCLKDDSAEEIRSCLRYFSVHVPKRADSKGLIESLNNALKMLEIDDVLDKTNVLDEQAILVGGGTDGASVNIAEQNGMKGTMQRALQWLFWSWCHAHCLELACKDALSSQLFKDVTEMLLRLYYLYKKISKEVS